MLNTAIKIVLISFVCVFLYSKFPIIQNICLKVRQNLGQVFDTFQDVGEKLSEKTMDK